MTRSGKANQINNHNVCFCFSG